MDNSTTLPFQLNTFGPTRPNAFDFTPLFENSFFILLPSSLFLIVAFSRTFSLSKKPRKVVSSTLRQIKIALLSALVAFNLTLLILWAVTPVGKTKTSVPASCLDFIASVGLLVLSSYEHTRSVAPSTVIAIYLLFTLPLDIARVRTLFLLDFESYSKTKSIAAVTTTEVVIKFGVLIFEAISKRRILLAGYRHLPPETTSGPYSRALFLWLTPLLRLGYTSFFALKDLDPIDSSLSSSSVSVKFLASWSSRSKTQKHALLRTTLSVLKYRFLVSAFPRLLLIGLVFAQPFLIQTTISYVSNRSNQPSNIGWGLIGAYALVYSGLALLTASSTYLMNRITIRLRSGLISLIYHKSLLLYISNLDQGEALTLMSTDVERIIQGLENLNNTWAAVIQVGIALYLLFRTLGIGFIAPGVCFLCALVAMVVCTKLAPRYQKVWVEGIQTRISATSGMLNSMRSIKLLGLSKILGDKIQGLRERENDLAKKWRWLCIFQVLFQNITSILVPVATFTVFVLKGRGEGKGGLDTAQAFVILSILGLVEPPLMLLVQTVPKLVASLGCFERVETFLKGEERRDGRLEIGRGSTSGSEVSIPGEGGIALRNLTRGTRRNEDVIVLNECSFGWTSDKPLVHNISMNIKRGSLSMIIGPTGCGKSTLIKGILGETPSSTGFVYLSTNSIAFADQEPWTINSTIKAGIVGESSFHEEFYNEVVESCALRADLDTFPRGDLTVVGSKGISLSGGQKSRLALARAVFARKEVLVLDDVFSGLDADTEEHIFRHLFGKDGILKREGMTCILVTHAVSRLSWADWAVVLTKEGKVEEQGTYAHLRQNGAYVANLDIRFKKTTNDSTALEQRTEPKKSGFNTPVLSEAVEEEEALNIEARKTGDWQTYLHYFRSAGPISSLIAFTFSFIYILTIKSPSLLIKLFTGPTTTYSTSITFLSILGSIAFISVTSFGFLLWLLSLKMVPRASNGLHQQLLTIVMNAPLSFFTRTDAGTTLNRFSQDLSLIDGPLQGALIATILNLALFLIGGALMAATATYSLTTIPVIIITLFLVQKFYLRTSRQLRHLELEAKAPLYTHFTETLSGLSSIRAFGWTREFTTRNMELVDKNQKPVYLLSCLQVWLGIVLDLLVTGLAVVLMIIIVSLRNKISPGLVGLGLINVMGFNQSMSLMIQLWTLTETSIGAIARVRDFVHNTENENILLSQSGTTINPPENWPNRGEIQIRNFSASYSSDTTLVLEDINLDIKPGEKIGICGRSGSGKSSIIASLFHMLEFRSGSITIDPLDLSLIPRDLLRQRLNVLPQETYWVQGESVRWNLDPWVGKGEIGAREREERDEEMRSVLRKCRVWDVIEGKGGLETSMEGEFLSWGQRQLFCLARALLRESRIVVLDEVSASVDIHTDEIIQKVIREEFEGCTIIAVAHRLNTLVDFDRVVVLSEGRVVECSGPQALLRTEGSKFRELWEM